MSVHLSVRGLAGEKELTDLDDGLTIGDLKRLGHITEGLTVRINGHAVDDDYEIEDDDVAVTTPPAAKHG